MQAAVRKEIMPGVYLTALRTRKFKTSCLSLNLITPLEADTASMHALLPSLLRRGTASYPGMEQFSAALDNLYGAYLEPCVRKLGQTQCVGFLCGFIDDAYTPDGAPLLERMCALLGEALLHPATRNGRFYPEWLEGEKDNLADLILSQRNDKRTYATLRLLQLMCADEPFGVDALGDEESARAITQGKLARQYQNVLENSPVELFFCGGAPFERVERALLDALMGLPRARRRMYPEVTRLRRAAPDAPRLFHETMDVTQGKLAMGFCTSDVLGGPEYPALMLFNAVYGATATSKLFMNVREKLSLCYYAGSALKKHKGLMVVSSGVEFDKYEAARDEILAQLDACRAGDFDGEELEAGRRAMVNALRAVTDSQRQMEDFYLGQALCGLDYGPLELSLLLEDVTRDRVIEAARRVELDSIYFLSGPRAEKEETL